ncbi:MAG: isoaspartyl peptidase/L-asparaginase [Candidatus Heimdallarchaeota archaeon]|nr:isoaspartyl peptidase/L-asparaginase [Candidatus Heimdallarchaeota archaeon]
MIDYGVIVHGGAWAIPDETVDAHLKGVETACNVAFQLIEDGKSAIDAVEVGISLMEDDPTFDAGRGSFLNQDSEVEMDAIIATQDQKIGAVLAVQQVKNPIKLARAIRERTDHIMIAGGGGRKLAESLGLELASEEDLLVGRELERYLKVKNIVNYQPKTAFDKPNGFGTVGMVAMDKQGNLAVGVSTGGTPYKRAGRVGDTPIWGAGAYVNELGGAAATGYGEDIIRRLSTRLAVQYLETMDPQQAAEQTVKDLSSISGLGGFIVLSKKGIGFAFNTPRMAYAYKTNKSVLVSEINP